MDFNSEILQRFFTGKYSRSDFLTIKSIFCKLENKQELKNLIQNHWFGFIEETLPDGNIDHVLHKIHHQIHLEEKGISQNQFIRIFQRIAAILIVPLILTFLAVLFLPKAPVTHIVYAQIQCPPGARTKFKLPDGTTGFLNSGSSLEYPVIFATNRNVVLKGEAYFDVFRDVEHPFTVKTPNLETKVRGTRFNVIAYTDENAEEIILREGEVEVYSMQGEKLETLKFNQRMALNTLTRQYSKNHVEADQYVSWTEGKLVFRNENMKQVASRLGRWYNAEILISDQELLKYSFRATFIDEPLEEVLKLLALTAPIQFKIQMRETESDNVYKRKQVIVSLDKKRLDAF